jgi:hypothetical protein
MAKTEEQVRYRRGPGGLRDAAADIEKMLKPVKKSSKKKAK